MMKIFIAGDMCLENRAEKLLKENRSVYSEGFSNYFSNADFRIANLESPITSSNHKINKVGRHIKVSPEVSNGMKNLQIDYFALANNHLMDYGIEGFNETIDVLTKNGIGYFGVRLKNENLSFTRLEKNNVKVGVIAISNNEFSLYQDFNGIGAIGFNETKTLKNIKELKNLVDHIVVIWHTGLSKFKYPSPNQHIACKNFIDAGASVVTCQHSHIVGAYEYYNDGFICYGQGSTIFDLNRISYDWNIGVTLNVAFEKKRFDVEVLPHTQFGHIPNVSFIDSNDDNLFNLNLKKTNQILSNKQRLQEKWNEYLNQKESYYFKSLIAPKNKVLGKLLNRIPFKKFITKNMKLTLLGYLQNEEHREVLIQLLKKDLFGKD